MLILAKSILGLTLGFVLATTLGLVLVPLLKKFHLGQSVSRTLNERHLKGRYTNTWWVDIYYSTNYCDGPTGIKGKH